MVTISFCIFIVQCGYAEYLLLFWKSRLLYVLWELVPCHNPHRFGIDLTLKWCQGNLSLCWLHFICLCINILASHKWTYIPNLLLKSLSDSLNSAGGLDYSWTSSILIWVQWAEIIYLFYKQIHHLHQIQCLCIKARHKDSYIFILVPW